MKCVSWYCFVLQICGKKIRNAYFTTCRYWEIMRLFRLAKYAQNDLKILHPLEPGQSRRKFLQHPLERQFSFLPFEIPDVISMTFVPSFSGHPTFQSTLKSCWKARHPKPVGRLFQERFQWVNSSDKTPAWNRAVNSTGPQQRKTIRWSKKNQCLDKNTSKITESIFLEFLFGKISGCCKQAPSSTWQPGRLILPSQTKPKRSVWPLDSWWPNGKKSGFFPPYRAKLGACCPTRRDHRGVFCPLLFASPSDRSDRWSVVKFFHEREV